MLSYEPINRPSIADLMKYDLFEADVALEEENISVEKMKYLRKKDSAFNINFIEANLLNTSFKTSFKTKASIRMQSSFPKINSEKGDKKEDEEVIDDELAEMTRKESGKFQLDLLKVKKNLGLSVRLQNFSSKTSNNTVNPKSVYKRRNIGDDSSFELESP